MQKNYIFFFNSKRDKNKEREKLRKVRKSHGYFKKHRVDHHHAVLPLQLLRWWRSREVFTLFFPCCLKPFICLLWSLGQFVWGAVASLQRCRRGAHSLRPHLGPLAMLSPQDTAEVGVPQLTHDFVPGVQD